MKKKWLKRIAYTLLILFVCLNIVCAFHAYRFTHFYSNLPPLKKPEQMNTGEKLSAMLFGVKYAKTKVVDSLSIPHTKVDIVTEDSLHLEGWYLKDSITALTSHVNKGTVILFHGHGGNKSGTIREAVFFYNKGYNVLMVDLRAHGNSQGEVCTIGYNESKDVKAAYDYIAATEKNEIVLWGVSLGAAVIMKAMYDYPIKPTKVILEMPFATLLDAVKGRVKMMGLPQQPISSLLTFWGGTEQGFWAFGHNPMYYAEKISCPVLLQWGLKDPRVTEEETNIIFKHLASHNKLLIKYANSGHQSLCKNEPEKWEQTVNGFLNQ